MYKLLVVSIDELWLKGKNRPAYFRAIKKHVVDVLTHYQDELIPIKNVKAAKTNTMIILARFGLNRFFIPKKLIKKLSIISYNVCV